MAKKTTEDTPGFEQQLQRLESIVQALETGQTGLEESLKLYEEGIILSGNCLKALNQAEARIIDLQKKLTPDQ
ncbi:MAG: exodeoxyribonuclease VII small subunit [Bacteroidetes bacterium]|nr:exodeoxyribonuclease VII small subunit [Bacteroidota bacterium]